MSTSKNEKRHIQVWSATPKFEKEPRSWGCEAQAFSRSHVKFLTAIREVRWGVSCLDFLWKILPRRSLERANGRWPFFWSGCNFYTTKRSHGLCGWAKYTGAFKPFAMILWSEKLKDLLQKISQTLSKLLFFGNTVAKK